MELFYRRTRPRIFARGDDVTPSKGSLSVYTARRHP